MKDSTTLKFSQKLLKYGALTAIIGGAAEANGQIIYTDVNPDEGGSGVLYSLDMDNDNNADFQIRHIDESASGGALNSLIMGPAVNSMSSFSNSIIASTNNYFVYPMVLDEGDPITAGNTWNNESFQSLNISSCVAGNWCSQTDKYVGLRFKIGADTYYGWARLDVGSSGANWVIKDYAYNSVAGAPINAGEMETLSVADNSFADKVAVVAANKNIALYNLPGKTEFSLYAMTGQEVLSGSTTADTYVIEANDVQHGLYVVQLKDEESGEFKRTKVML